MGDAIGDYATLAHKGYDYGRLAAGLADNETFNGQADRAFAASVAEKEDPAGMACACSLGPIGRRPRLVRTFRMFARFDSGGALV